MSEELTFRRYHDSDFPEYASVFKTVYGKELDPDFFGWKHLHNPAFDQGALIYLALNEEGRIIGANSFFPYILAHKGQTYRAVQSGDTMVLPAFRGKGIFQKILAYAVRDLRQNNYALIYGYANGNSYPGFLKFGFADLGRINIYYRILDWRGFLGRKGKIPGLAGLAVDKTLEALRQVTGLAPADNYEAVSANLADPEVCQFIEESQGTDIHPRKDESYLAWKYLDKPAASYKTIVVRKNGKIAAVLVIRIDRYEEQRAGEILEFIIPEPMNAKPVLREVLAQLYRSGLVFLRIWEPSDKQIMSALSKNLFLKRKVELYFIALALQEKLNFLTDRRLWQISGGDADTA